MGSSHIRVRILLHLMLVIVSTLKIIIIVTIIITIRVFFCEQIISYVYLLYTLSVGNNYKVKRHPQVCN